MAERKYNYDEIPETEQGINLYKMYCNKEIKTCQAKMRRLSRFIDECDRRIGVFNDNEIQKM